MISFKSKEDSLPSALILLSIVIVIGVIAYVLFFPAPNVQVVNRQELTKQRNLERSIQVDQEEAKEARAAIAPRLWKGDENHVGASVLALVTNTTLQDGVKLTAFRPQRTVDLQGVTELPYVIQLSGPYSGIRAVMHTLDSSDSKIVLQSAEVNASEEVTGSVTSSVGICAFITTDPLIIASIPDKGGQNEEVH
jgi:Tfp pilus assembly protein PilO